MGVGKRGPAPKPRALRLLHGDRQDRINDYEPVPSVEPIEPPGDISAEVRAVWEFTVRHLEIMGTAAASDRDLLRAYCEAVVAHTKASEILARSAVLIKGIHGNLVRNPALQIQRDSARTMLRFAQEFGLTPSARTQIEVGGAGRGEDSPFSGTG